MAIIYPTHTCFDDAVQIMADLVRENRETLNSNRFVIVHAIVAPEGKESSHAWVEDTEKNLVIFMGLLNGDRMSFSVDLGEYYLKMNVRDFTKYTIAECIAEEKKTGQERSYGPWKEKYRELCGDY